MPDSHDVQRLLADAAGAPTLHEAQAKIVEAEDLRSQLYAQARADRELDFASAIVQDHLRPVAVHERHTTATDWIADIPTVGPADLRQQMLAQASLWYDKIPLPVKENHREFGEQALGMARRLAGAYGEQAQSAQDSFLEQTTGLWRREASLGVFQAQGPSGGVGETFPTGVQYQGLPSQDTSSARAVNLQELEQNSGRTPSQDVTPVNDPGLGQADPTTDQGNGDAGTAQSLDLGQDKQASRRTAAMKCDHCRDSVQEYATDNNGTTWYTHGSSADANKHQIHVNGVPKPTADEYGGVGGPMAGRYAQKESNMQHAQCPTCGGHGRVAVRRVSQPSILDIVAGRKVGVSGLDQIDQTVDPHDNGPAPTPYPQEVAFPWTIGQGQEPVQQTINEAEGQIAQRNQMSPTARRKVRLAQEAARLAYRQVMAGMDDSGWMGDMGQTPAGPGAQDGGNPGGQTNLGMPDDVYGYGGDNPNQPLKPYGADEADDYTSNPGMNYQPGQPTQMDMGTRVNTTQAPPGGGAPGFPNPPMGSGMTGPMNNGKKSSRQIADETSGDPEIQKALAFVRHRRAFLEQQAS